MKRSKWSLVHIQSHGMLTFVLAISFLDWAILAIVSTPCKGTYSVFSCVTSI